MEDWKLPSAVERCSTCAAELQAGQPVTSVIRLAADGPGRQDLCATCGQTVGSEAEVFFWRRQRPATKTRQAIVDYTLLRELFSRLLERPGALYERLSYLVALVLIRKRHLRLRGFEPRAGREVMLVTRGAGEPALEVPAPYLTPEDMVEVRAHLNRLLQADLPDDLLADPDRGESAATDAEPTDAESTEAC
jgi:hypothetical protein